jgi:Head domain of trimeric autotransporter adhesin
MSEYFRTVRGLEIDDRVRILQGTGVPGNSADTDAAQVGSLYLNNTNGSPYSKITAGSGTARWAIISGALNTSQALYVENSLAPTPPSALGINSLALGSGAQTSATAPNSIAIGDQALTRHQGAEVFANGRFGSAGDVQVGKYLLRTVTVNNIPTEAFLDGTNGSLRLVLPDDSTWTFKATITGHRTDATDGHAGYTIQGVVYRKAGVASIAIQGAVIKNVLAESNIPWDANITVDIVTGSLVAKVTGQTGKIIRWAVLVETVEITN